MVVIPEALVLISVRCYFQKNKMTLRNKVTEVVLNKRQS